MLVLLVVDTTTPDTTPLSPVIAGYSVPTDRLSQQGFGAGGVCGLAGPLPQVLIVHQPVSGRDHE